MMATPKLSNFKKKMLSALDFTFTHYMPRSFRRSDGVEIPLLEPPFCRICSEPLHEKYSEHGICRDCHNRHLRNRSRPDILVKAAEYYIDNDFSHTLSNEIRRFKSDPSMAERLGECLVHVFKNYYRELHDSDLIIPLFNVDNKRTYNQAALLAGIMSRELSIPTAEILFLEKPVPPLRQMKLEAREEVLKDNVGCRENVKGRKILLIDDVYTTGATIRESGWVLTNNGADLVQGLVVGRATDTRDLRFAGRLK